MKNFIRVTISLTFFAGAIMSCEKTLLNEDKSSTFLYPNNSFASREYLEFKNEAAFAQTLDELSRKTQTQLDEWEKQQGFVSMRKRFNEVVKAVNADKGLKPLTTREAALYETTYLPSKEGGIEPNIADWRMMALVNVEGIIKIGGVFHQFKNDETKSLQDRSEVSNEVDILKEATQSDTKSGLTVAQVHTTRHIVNDQRVNGTTVKTSRSCESASGDPFEWRMIAYEEVLSIERGGEEQVCSWGVTYGPNGPTNTYTCTTVYNPTLYQTQAQLKIRTLKRGSFGAWTDRESSEQRASGSWKLTTSSVVAPGWNSGNTGIVTNPYQFNSYNVTNTTGETSTLNFIFWTSSLASSGNSNIYLDSSSYHDPKWNSYGCECHI